MAKISVTVRADRGDLGVHPKYGALFPGAKLVIEEEEFGAELFERPSPDWRSPLELADAQRAAELKQRVGHQDPPAEPAKKAKEVGHA